MNTITRLAGATAGAAIFVASSVFAQTATGTAPVTQQAPAALSCMQTAVTARATAIIAAWDAYHDVVKTGMQNLNTALNAGWGMTDKKARRDAIKAAWKQYDTDIKAARADWKKGRQAAWNAFYAARKACDPKASKDDMGTSGADGQL